MAGIGAVATARAAHAAFPGANGPIVYSSAANSINEISSSTGITSSIGAPGATPSQEDRVSADGTTIVYSTGAVIDTVPITGGSVTTVNGTAGTPDDPSFTPDGRTIVYQNGLGTGLLTVPAAGGGATTIFGSILAGDTDSEPEVSPNGATIAFVSALSGAVFTIPIGGGSVSQVTVTGANIEQVSWSPDGTKLAVDNNTGIAVVSATGNNQALVNLPNSTSPVLDDPSWSPDGTKIAGFDGTHTGNIDIIAANGSPGVTTLTGPASTADAYWAPAATATTTTTTPGGTTTTTCAGTLTGTAYKGSKVKKHGLAGVTVMANPGALTATTNASGVYSSVVACGPYTKTASGPKKSSRVCHFGSGSGPISATATVTSGSTDAENLFCLKA